MSFNAIDLEMLSLSQLANLYNSGADEPVKKFGSRQLGLQRVRKLQEQLQRPVISVNGEYRFAEGAAAPVAPPAVTEEPEEEPVAVTEEPTEEEPAQTEEEQTEEEPVASPFPALPKVDGAAIQAKREAKRKPKAEGVASVGRGEYKETQVLRVVNPVSARDGSKRAARFAALKDGITVGFYLDAAHAANHGSRPRHRYHSDIRRLVEAGHLRVE